MKTLFAPAIGLMNRLPYLGKFTLLACVFAVTNLTFLGEILVGEWRQIEAAESGRAGVELLIPLNRLVGEVQRHRAASAAVLDGNTVAGIRQPEAREAVEQTLAELARRAAAGRQALLGPSELERLRRGWTAAQDSGSDWTRMFGAHSRLVAETASAIVSVGNRSGLSYENDRTANQLAAFAIRVGPQLREEFARVRGVGMRHLADGVLSTEEISQIRVLLVSAEATENRLRRVHEELARVAPALADRVGPLVEQLALAHQDLSGVVESASRPGAGPSPAQYFALASKPVDIAYQIEEICLPALAERVTTRGRATWTSLLLHLVFSLVASAAVLYMLAGFYLATRQAFSALNQASDDFSQGDFSQRIRVDSRDEVAVIVEHFNKMADGIGELVREVQRGVRTLEETSGQLSRASAQVAEASHQQSTAAQSAASAVEQMTSSIGQVAEGVEGSVETSQRARELSESGGSIVDAAALEITRMAHAVRESSSTIAQLSEHSARVNGIVRVIREVADQTNLLALNAAIEAARAGEMGRGFAVVADEVRKLAERTAQATNEIASVIENIEQGTRDSVDGIQTAAAQVDNGVAQARRAAAALAEIHEGTSVTLERIAAIAEAAREQRSASRHISGDVDSIARMARETDQTVRDIDAAARHMAQQAATLASLMKRFRIAG